MNIAYKITQLAPREYNNFIKTKNNGIGYYYYSEKRNWRKILICTNYNGNIYTKTFALSKTRDDEKYANVFEKNIQRLAEFINKDYNYRLG